MTLEVNPSGFVPESPRNCNNILANSFRAIGAAVLSLFLTSNPMRAEALDLCQRSVVPRFESEIRENTSIAGVEPRDEETDSDDEVESTSGIEAASEVFAVEGDVQALTTSELIYVIHDPKTQTDSYLIGAQHDIDSGQVAIKSPVLLNIIQNCTRVYTEAGDLYSSIRSTSIESLGYDDAIVKMAIEENVEIIGLDTNVSERRKQCAEQAKNQGRPLSEVERMYRLMSEPGESNPELLHEIKQSQSAGFQSPFAYDAWRHGDASYLTKEREHSQSNGPLLYERLHTRREKIWLEKLSKDLCDGRGSLCIAVGSCHLFGKDGMIANLQKQGFEVSRAPFSVCSAEFSAFDED